MAHAAPRRLPLHTKILIGLLLGAVFGILAQVWIGDRVMEAFGREFTLKSIAEDYVRPVGRVFLYLIFMIVVPFLFSALVLGVAEIGDAKRIGRVGMRSLLMTVLLSGIAVLLGLAAVYVFDPAGNLTTEQRANLLASYSSEKDAKANLARAETPPDDPPLLGFIPQNPVKESVRALEGGLLPFMFFALVFGIALASVDPEKGLPVRQLLEGLFAVSLRIIDYAMALAPFGVFALVFYAAAVLGIPLLLAVGKYVLVVLGALALHQFGTYSLALRFIAKRNPLEFFRQIRVVMLTAFGTSSSNATLPTALKAAQNEVGLPRDISSFVLTVGATANQNGTALFEGITILFLADMFGMDLTTGQQLMVMGLAIVAGIGTAGVPGGAWPMIAVILVRLGVPAEAIGLVLGVDRILDMSRTVLNVTGDITIAACVSQMEGRGSEVPEEALSG
ncbi:MAG TPA: dicarboxylate/amino acid:cation symporter [Fimbriimonadaceae bacterium]|nr:dicarboxylate/amino acid:cation symporter [Fimbriimonadaceae bacterium]